MIIYANDSGIIDYPDISLHDPNSQIFYSMVYRPNFRSNNTSYIQDADVVIPTIPNGCMYECISGGISANADFTFPTLEGKSFDDGTVKWRTLPYSAKLGYGDVISSSTWSSSVGVTLGTMLMSGTNMTMCKVLSVTPELKSFILTNTTQVTRSNGLTEQFDKSVRIKVSQL